MITKQNIASILANDSDTVRINLSVAQDDDGYFVVTDSGEDASQYRYNSEAEAIEAIFALWSGEAWDLQSYADLLCAVKTVPQSAFDGHNSCTPARNGFTSIPGRGLLQGIAAHLYSDAKHPLTAADLALYNTTIEV